ncbi:MAG: hypothetical protein K2O29_09600 [Ruminococcus sp.]|nr:hypothetical protein [Ruminococcus sp.]
MTFNKSSVLFGASLICFGVFIISFLKLIFGDASDLSKNYGFSYLIIAGIVIAIPTIIEIFKRYKTAGNKNLISFTIGCFKKENGKELHHLALALLFSIFPVVILIGVLFLGSGSSNTSDSSKNSGQTNRVATSSNNDSNSDTKNNRQTKSSDSSKSNREINRIAGSSANEIKTVTDGVHNEIQKVYRNKPRLNDEEALEIVRKHNPNMNIETVRAHKPM